MKLKFDFSGFDKMLEDAYKMQKDVKGGVENGLIKSKEYINSGLKSAMEKHHRTGETIKTLTDEKVVWSGTVASIGVGFDLTKGQVPLFLSYGTKVFGTPRVKKDMKLWRAMYGKETKEKIAEIQRVEFSKIFN